MAEPAKKIAQPEKYSQAKNTGDKLALIRKQVRQGSENFPDAMTMDEAEAKKIVPPQETAEDKKKNKGIYRTGTDTYDKPIITYNALSDSTEGYGKRYEGQPLAGSVASHETAHSIQFQSEDAIPDRDTLFLLYKKLEELGVAPPPGNYVENEADIVGSGFANVIDRPSYRDSLVANQVLPQGSVLLRKEKPTVEEINKEQQYRADAVVAKYLENVLPVRPAFDGQFRMDIAKRYQTGKIKMPKPKPKLAKAGG